MYYRKLDIDNFKNIQEKVIPYTVNFISQKENSFYNLISKEELQELKKNIPELFECIQEELGSEIIFASYIFVDKNTEVPIHVDGGDFKIQKRIRLNWPILNGSSAETVIYKKNHNNIKGKIHSHSWGTATYYENSDCHEVDRYILNLPTLMNVKELHSIRILNDELPRILLSMRLSNEDEVYKKYF